MMMMMMMMMMMKLLFMHTQTHTPDLVLYLDH